MMRLNYFKEYAKAINFYAGFKNFNKELTSLNIHYTAPNGCLKNNEAIGCVAVKKTQQEVAELKRFYVKPEFRKFKVGARLLETALENAKTIAISLPAFGSNPYFDKS